MAELLAALTWDRFRVHVAPNGNMVSKWERGEKGMSRLYRACYRLIPLLTPADVMSYLAGIGTGDPMNRRHVLRVGAAAGTAAALQRLAPLVDTDELGRMDAVLSEHCQADMQVAAHLEALLARYRALDDLVGPHHVLPLAQAVIGVVEGFCRNAPPAARRALLAVGAQYEQLTGWLWVDSGHAAEARAAYDRAAVRAAESGEQPLTRYLLACKAEQALMTGERYEAAMLAQEAQRIVEGSSGKWKLTDAVLAWASDLEARALALLGQAAACKRQLAIASELLARTAQSKRVGEPPWVYHFVEPALAVHTGICLTELGEADEAADIFERVMAAVPTSRVRDRAYYLSCQAKAHARSGDDRQATVVACQAARLAVETSSTRVLAGLKELHAQLDHNGVAGAAELAEALQP